MRILLSIVFLLASSQLAYADWFGIGDTAVKGANAYKTIEEVNHMAGLTILALTAAVFGSFKFLPYLTPMPYIRKAVAFMIWVIAFFMIMLVYEQYEPYFLAIAGMIAGLFE